MVKKTKQYITENTMIAEVVENFPEVAEILTEDYGFHCVSCFAAEMETVGMGAMGHGMTQEEIDDMLVTINDFVDKQRTAEKSK
jgi:hybrid cluster-associated redox disulfide protein